MQRITLPEAIDLLPLKNGKRVHKNTLKNWVARGSRGVRLQAELIAGQWFTTAEWVQQFIEAVTQSAIQKTAGSQQPDPSELNAIHQQANNAAAREYLKRKWGFHEFGTARNKANPDGKKTEVPDVPQRCRRSRAVPGVPRHRLATGETR